MAKRKYFDSLINKIGWGLFVLGSGPLLLIIFLAKVGIWPDPNPNPVGLGMMAFFTFWPSIICIAIGSITWWRKKHHEKSNA
jgi:hypothetical protein